MKPISYQRHEVAGQIIVFPYVTGKVKGDLLRQVSASLPTGSYFVYLGRLYVRMPQREVGGREDYYGLLRLPEKGPPTYLENGFCVGCGAARAVLRLTSFSTRPSTTLRRFAPAPMQT